MSRLLRKCVWGFGLLACSGAGQATNAVVSTCTEAGFMTAFNAVDGSGGGTITFTCSGTITFTSLKQVSGNDVIDGGNNVTFGGNDSSPLFQVFFGKQFTLKRLSMQHAVSVSGAYALENFGTLDLVNVTLSNSHLLQAGFVVNHGTLNVSGSTFSSNNIIGGSLAGVAIDNDGTAAIGTSTFASNVIDSTIAGTGGAINNNGGALFVHASTFTANSAFNGAAIFSSGEMHVINSTFQGNFTAGTTGGGGAIYQTGTSNSTLDFATVVGNSASYGAGIYSDGATSGVMTVGKSIIAGNNTGNCDGGAANYVSGGYNVGTSSCIFFGVTDTVSANAGVLDALGNYGGPTQTMRLSSSTNPAYNKVPAANCKESTTGTSVRYDQRVATRPTGSACDSGAYQHNGVLNDRIFGDGFDF